MKVQISRSRNGWGLHIDGAANQYVYTFGASLGDAVAEAIASFDMEISRERARLDKAMSELKGGPDAD